MADSLTSSVARLHRAGLEHSQQMEKLREAAKNLLKWLRDNVPLDFQLPDDCKIYPSGEFIKYGPGQRGIVLFQIGITHPIARTELLCFAHLIADGWLDRLADAMGNEAIGFGNISEKIDLFLTKK